MSNTAAKTQGGAPALVFADITPTRRLTPEAAERHTKLVRTLRLAVPAAACVLLITYALNAAPPSVDTDFLRQFSDAEAPGRDLVLERPRYRAETEGGSPFEVSAQAARRNPDEGNIIRFDNPEAYRGEGREGPARLRARAGTLDTETNLFEGEDVRLVQNIGGQDFTLRTDRAEVDIDGKTIRSKAAVSGEGEAGALEADGLTLSEDGSKVRLEGRVRARFEPSKAPGKTPGETPRETEPSED